MSRLIHANLYRLRRSRLFWGVLLACALESAYLCAVNRDVANYYEWNMMQIPLYLTFVDAAFVGMFIGTDWSDGTLRNRLIVGHTRAAAYFSNLATTALCCVAFQAASFAVFAGLGIPLIGAGYGAGTVLTAVAVVLFACVGFAALMTAISMNVPSRSAAILVGMGVTFLLVLFSAQVWDALEETEYVTAAGEIVITEDGTISMLPHEQEENPRYIPEGPLRDALTTLNLLLPSGQMLRADGYFSRFSPAPPDPAREWPLPLLMLLFSALATLAGYALFRGRDVK